MFQKADGSMVWLRAPGSLPYLVLRGAIETAQGHTELQSRLGRIYRSVPELACGDVFLMADAGGGNAILFGARPDNTGDLIVLGRHMSDAGENLLSHFHAVIDTALADLAHRAGVHLHLQTIEPELALRIS